MKYKTMKPTESAKEIELSSEFSQSEPSGEEESETVLKLRTTWNYSENEGIKEPGYPKLIHNQPKRKTSTDIHNNNII